MVGIQVRASEGLALTGVGGIALLGYLLERHTDFRSSFTAAFSKRRDGIPWGDVLLTYVASLATGKSDFEAIRPWQGKTWVGKALRISTVASPETVRQRLDNLADGHSLEALELAGQASLDLLANGKAPFTKCSTGHVPLDVDTTPQENGKTRKERDCTAAGPLLRQSNLTHEGQCLIEPGTNGNPGEWIADQSLSYGRSTH